MPRFRSRVLLDATAKLSAMACVNLNPIRAGMTLQLDGSVHTSILKRIRAIESDRGGDTLSCPTIGNGRAAASVPRRPEMAPEMGIRGLSVTALSSIEYIELVDMRGREWHPTKRGRITGKPQAVLDRLGMDSSEWTHRVRAVKPEHGFCRVIGSERALLGKAAEIGQRWLRGLGVARLLSNWGLQAILIGAAGAWRRWLWPDQTVEITKESVATGARACVRPRWNRWVSPHFCVSAS